MTDPEAVSEANALLNEIAEHGVLNTQRHHSDRSTLVFGSRRVEQILDGLLADRAALVAERDKWEDLARAMMIRAEKTEAELAQAVAERDQAEEEGALLNDALAREQAIRRQVVAERDRYQDALQGIYEVVTEPFEGTVLRGLSSVGRAHAVSLARAALAVSTP